MDQLLDRLMRILPPETDSDNRIVIRYGLELFILRVLFSAAVLLVSLLFGCFLQVLVFMIMFIPLREAAGGYHSQSRVACFLESLMLTGVVIAAVTIPVLSNESVLNFVAAFAGVAVILLYLRAPADTEQKRLDDEQFVAMRKRTRLILTAEVIIAITLLVAVHMTGNEWISKAFLCAALSINFSGILVGAEELYRTIKKPNISSEDTDEANIDTEPTEDLT
jgi:accessory gene regulator B